LVVGTFGRAIWVLDDLKSLREVAANRLKASLTALPMNDAVQVKGLFINPPGNIWTGFHTTFEGENRPFQATEIPFYLKENPTKEAKVVARLYNANNEHINTLEAGNLKAGLNYLLWKLDAQVGTPKPNASSREIPVLPGMYKVVLEYQGAKDSTSVQVIPDPRFDIPASVDEKLYAYQKAVYQEKVQLDAQFDRLDSRAKLLDKIEKHYADTPTADKDLVKAIANVRTDLKALREKGKPTAGARQVGAWQTLEISPTSLMQEAEMAAMSRHVAPSEQDWQRVSNAKASIDSFEKQVGAFVASTWKGFEEKVKGSGVDWFEGLK
ncbi:MAG: hypothetical protein KKG00_04220, partial [Bacteroidetes bacterium]|nr:hypothetical protein [Bacteroidota bacterium]